VHLLSLLIMVVNLSPASVPLDRTPSLTNHVVVAETPQYPYPPIVTDDPTPDNIDGPEYPPLTPP
jgi:hypothetical protein